MYLLSVRKYAKSFELGLFTVILIANAVQYRNSISHDLYLHKLQHSYYAFKTFDNGVVYTKTFFVFNVLNTFSFKNNGWERLGTLLSEKYHY